VAILVVPVTLQIFSRYTALIPSYIWTEEMARFLFIWTIMIGAMIGVRESTHFEVDVWPQLSRRGEAVAAARRSACWQRHRVRGRHRVHAFAWNRTSELATAAVAHPHRLARARAHLDRLPRRADSSMTSRSFSGGAHDGAVLSPGTRR
jgi:hypothetical protein